jgi:hypothetical protein
MAGFCATGFDWFGEKLMKSLISLLVVLCLVGCVTEKSVIRVENGHKLEISGAQEKHDLFVGKWYEKENTDSGGVQESISEHFPDGTTRVEFRITENGSSTRQTEYGVWGVSGNFYFTMTQGFISDDGQIEPADTRDASLYDVYEIVDLSVNSMTYKNVETGNVFTAKRVSKDFKMPVIL